MNVFTKSNMKLALSLLIMTAAGVTVGGPAAAGVCDAPFMHEQGRVELTGSGVINLGAQLSFSQVKKTGPDQCQARVTGVTRFGFAALPPRNSNIDYVMQVNQGKASFARVEAGGTEPLEGDFDLRMLGLFSYGEPITRSGQTFPAMDFKISADSKLGAAPVIVRTGEKTVGDRQQIDTAAGAKSCWPIRYQRVIEATQASFNGIVLPIPGMTSAVTDWYCPELNMVMKQLSVQSGVGSQVEVTLLE